MYTCTSTFKSRFYNKLVHVILICKKILSTNWFSITIACFFFFLVNQIEHPLILLPYFQHSICSVKNFFKFTFGRHAGHILLSSLNGSNIMLDMRINIITICYVIMMQIYLYSSNESIIEL